MMSADHTTSVGELPAPAISDAVVDPRWATGGWRVSSTLTESLEHMRARFGIGFEVVDAALEPVTPPGGGELWRAFGASAENRAQLASAIATGRSGSLIVGEFPVSVQPLRAPGRRRSIVGLALVRGDRPTQDAADRWADVIRTMLEADLGSSASLFGERARARHGYAMLRFMGDLPTIESEVDLMRAVVDAAAVWFDADARVYERDLTGHLSIHTHLPGVQVTTGARLDPAVVNGPHRSLRLTTTDTADELRWASPQVLLVPMSVESRHDWVIALGGALPEGADEVFEAMGTAASAQLQRVRMRRRASVRRRMEARIAASPRSPDWLALALLREVMDESRATAGALTLHEPAGTRRLAAVAVPSNESRPAPSEPILGPYELLWPIQLVDDTQAVLELHASTDGPGFTRADASAVEEAMGILQVWLRAALPNFIESMQAGSGERVDEAAFLQRIREELERAKRFDLALSLLLIDLESRSEDRGTAVPHVVDHVRRELRGSDLMGLVGPGRIAVLLVHTDARGTSAVLPRIRRRLRSVLDARLPAATLGLAMLSADCGTVDDLLSRASRDVEPIAAA